MMLLALVTLLGLTSLAPPSEVDGSDEIPRYDLAPAPDPNAVQPEEPAPAPAELTPAERAKQAEATATFVRAGIILIPSGGVPLILGSIWYGLGRRNASEGSDSEPGVPYGPVVMAVGGIIMSTGFVLLGIGLHRKKQARTVRVQLAPMLTWHRDGAHFGVVGSF